MLHRSKTEALSLTHFAAVCIEEGDLGAAEAAAELATVADPGLQTAWVLLGAMRARQRNASTAVAAYVRALELDAGDIASWVDLGELCIQLLDYRRAAAALKQALLLDPDAAHPAGRRARVLIGKTVTVLRGKN